MQHQSVLLQETIEALALKPDGIYLDGTFGRGGHSKAILARLSAQGRLLAIDKDPAAITYAQQHFKDDKRFEIFHGSFAQMDKFVSQIGLLGKIDGILLDLGVSSPQLDEAERGFSFMQSGPLDMRMDSSQALDAAYFVNNAAEKEMVAIFREYGEERFAGRIARAIIAERSKEPIKTTDRLAEIVKAANPKWEKHKHPATRVFQAIRIHVNEELTDLQNGLRAAIACLAGSGRLAVISFHSLEDRIVKQFMRKEQEGNKPPPGVPIKEEALKTNFKRIGKAIMPQVEELSHNIRARSAVLRVGEKIK